MVNKIQLDLLIQGAEIWNTWRKKHPDVHPLLKQANLSGVNLSGVDLGEVNLSKADLSKADLSKADLSKADLSKADLSGADLSGADLSGALLVRTNLTKAALNYCRVYGTSAWDVQLEGAIQRNLVITPSDQPEITADNLDVAQFIYLLLNNRKIPLIIDTINSKIVLILGRFTSKWRVISDAIKDELRKHNYLPVLFDFDRPDSRDLTETLSTLAHLSRFIIVDLSDSISIPQELTNIVPQVRVPVQPLIDSSASISPMFMDLSLYPWVLQPCVYKDRDSLIKSFQRQVIEPSDRKVGELGLK